MKKILSLILLFSMLLVVCACNPNTETSDEISVNVSENETSDVSKEESTEEEKGMTSPVIYELPDGETKNESYLVTVSTEKDPEKKTVDCYSAKVATGRNGLENVITEEMAFCYFDYNFSSPVYLTVTPNEEKMSAKVLPESAGVESEYKDGTLTVVLTKPVKLSIEFDGDIYHNLFVYANEYDERTPREDSPVVKYYGAGVHDVGEIRLNKGEVLYIAAGAVVYGNVVANNANDIIITGHGILDGSKIPHEMDGARKRMLDINNCNDVLIDGIIVRDASTWTCVIEKCKNVKILDMKQICYNFNSDGFDIVGSSDVLIDGAFIRNYDDNISLKAWSDRDCTNITMQNSILWADCAHNMLVGPEAKTADHENKFSNILFKNIDILESNEGSDFYRGVMSLTCSDSAVFENITWEDIRIERMTNGRFLNFRFSDDYGEKLGTAIRNVTIKNVTAKTRAGTKSYIYGTKDSPIENLTIENFTVAGEKLTHEYFGNPAKYITSFKIDGIEKDY